MKLRITIPPRPYQAKQFVIQKHSLYVKSVWENCINPKGWIHLWNGNDIDRGPVDQSRGPSGTSLWWPWLASDLAVRRYNYLLSTQGTNPSTNARSLLQSLWPRWHWQSCGLVTIPQGRQRFTTKPRSLWPGWYAMDASPAQWTHQFPPWAMQD